MAIEALRLQSCEHCARFVVVNDLAGQCQQSGVWIALSNPRRRCHSFQFAAVVGRLPGDLAGASGEYKVRQQLSGIKEERAADHAKFLAKSKWERFSQSGTGAPVTTGSKSHFETKARENHPAVEAGFATTGGGSKSGFRTPVGNDAQFDGDAA